MHDCLSQYFRCPEQFDPIVWKEPLSAERGYFLFGKDSTCFGAYHAQRSSPIPAGELHDAFSEVLVRDGNIWLPFDPLQVVENLHNEIYVGEWRQGPLLTLSQIYYFMRPALPVPVRRHLQMLYLGNWKRLSFPSWPVDCSVNNLMERLLLLALQASGKDRIPFIWFWPEGSSSSAIMTHDVETLRGCEYCPTLMDVDDSFGIKSSFQIIPEERYQARPEPPSGDSTARI